MYLRPRIFSPPHLSGTTSCPPVAHKCGHYARVSKKYSCPNRHPAHRIRLITQISVRYSRRKHSHRRLPSPRRQQRYSNSCTHNNLFLLTCSTRRIVPVKRRDLPDQTSYPTQITRRPPPSTTADADRRPSTRISMQSSKTMHRWTVALQQLANVDVLRLWNTNDDIHHNYHRLLCVHLCQVECVLAHDFFRGLHIPHTWFL